MLTNYLFIAWRNLRKNLTVSAIHIFGISTGIAAFLLMVTYLRFEYSFDRFHSHADRIFRVPMVISEKNGKEQRFAFTYPAVAPTLRNDFPEIEESVRFLRRSGVVSREELKIVEEGSIYYTDPSVFRIFSFRFKKGNPETAFRELNDAVITEETALKYFGHADPVGKAIRYENEDYVVKAVLENIPANSHLQFNILLNFKKYIQLTGGRAETSWGWSDFYTYILLKKGTDAGTLQTKMHAFADRYLGKEMQQTGYQMAFFLQPLPAIHIKSDYDYEMPGNGNLTYLPYLG
jgi:putative ABC transport system permease protein